MDGRALVGYSEIVKYLRNQVANYDLTALMKDGFEYYGQNINVVRKVWANEEYMALNGSQLQTEF